MFFYNTRVLSVNRKNLQSLNLSWTNLGEPCARPLSCTTSPQPTMYYVSFRWLVLWHHDDCCILDSKNRIHPPECTFFIDIEQLHIIYSMNFLFQVVGATTTEIVMGDAVLLPLSTRMTSRPMFGASRLKSQNRNFTRESQ